MEFIGRNGTRTLFVSDDKGVVIDDSKNIVAALDIKEPLIASFEWDPKGERPTDSAVELAAAALTSLDIKVFSNNDRMYTIPDSVVAEAKRGLAWHKEENRGGTSVGMNTARTLARGGQIGIRKVRHIAKYFPRHQVDKKGTGYKPGQKNYPSNGRIAWALWGGDAAERWASAIVDRENKAAKSNAIIAYGFESYEHELPTAVDYNSFITSKTMPEDNVIEFFVRIRMDGSGIDRLYRIEPNGLMYVWDDGNWDDMGNPENDLQSYDKMLDDIEDVVPKTHMPVDTETALLIAALLDNEPLIAHRIDKLQPEEHKMIVDAQPEIDWELMDEIIMPDEEASMWDYDDSLTAAGPAPTNQDGTYTPAERSKNTEAQLRDKSGKFAKMGGRVVIGGRSNYQGNIRSIDNATGTVKVELDNGNLIDVNAKLTEPLDTYTPIPQGFAEGELDTNGILGEPRTPMDSPIRMPGTLPPLNAANLNTMLTDFPTWVADQRLSPDTVPDANTNPQGMKGRSENPLAKYYPEAMKDPTKTVNAYNIPVLKKWLEADPANRRNTPFLDPKDTNKYIEKRGTDSPWLDKAGKPTGNAPKPVDTPSKPTSTATQPVSANKTLPNGVVQSGTAQAPVYTKSINSNPVQTDKEGTPLKGTYVEIPEEGYKLGSSVVKPGESSGSLHHTGEIGAATQKYDKNYDGVREYKTSNGETFYGKRGVVVPAGKMMTSSGTIVDRPKVASAVVAAGVQESTPITPETSDVPVIHMAIVSPDDPQAVMDLVALVPASNTSTAPSTFTRKDGKWILDSQILSDLRSATPPPAVVLDDTNLVDVLEQVDSKKPAKKDTPVTAAGGADRNRGEAEKLRRYWTYGKGAAKIRWKTPGDWTRCYKQLAKYMGPRAKGYCALRHKEMNGYWPGDRKNDEKSKFSINTMHSYEELLSTFTMRAKAADAKARVLTAGAYETEETAKSQGAEFVIPLVIPEGMESGDGRIMRKGALDIRELPLPLLWQIKTGEGHDGSVVVGQIVSMERTDDGIGNARGHFDTGEYGKEAERLVRGGFIRGVSADLDQFEADDERKEDENGSDTKVEAGKITITKARVMAVTIVPKPAFQECTIQLADQASVEEDEVNIPDGVYVEGVNALEASALVACGMIAGAIPVTPPTEWFNDPHLKGPTPLTVDDDGRVFGHIAAWHVDHIGMTAGTKPPRSRSKYAYFHTGVVRTDNGTDVPVGQLTLAGGHAGLEASASEAVRHYDDTASAIADVHAGEDAYGIWVAGSVRPGSSPEQIRALRASAPSGDWRPIKNSLELVAVCQVNVPGFPIARARVASGQVMALVAAGASTLAMLKNDPLTELNNRIADLEGDKKMALVASANDVRARFETNRMEVLAAKKLELAAKVKKVKEDVDQDIDYMTQNFDENPETELAVISRRVRERLAEEGKALPNGSYPIRNTEDLKNAVRAYGRAKPGEKGKVKRHIMKRAIGLGKEELIPENWKGAASNLDEIVASMKSRTEEFGVLIAAGGADRNRGNAEKLRRYWVSGKGAAKIRWGTPGDWKRCVRYLSKYMGPRSKGYCQLRHKEALGIYTATHAKRDRGGKS